jgi:hypothetical protein
MLLATAVSLLLTANPESTLNLAMPSFDAVGYDASNRSAFAEHLVQQIKTGCSRRRGELALPRHAPGGGEQ